MFFAISQERKGRGGFSLAPSGQRAVPAAYGTAWQHVGRHCYCWHSARPGQSLMAAVLPLLPLCAALGPAAAPLAPPAAPAGAGAWTAGHVGPPGSETDPWPLKQNPGPGFCASCKRRQRHVRAHCAVWHIFFQQHILTPEYSGVRSPGRVDLPDAHSWAHAASKGLVHVQGPRALAPLRDRTCGVALDDRRHAGAMIDGRQAQPGACCAMAWSWSTVGFARCWGPGGREGVSWRPRPCQRTRATSGCGVAAAGRPAAVAQHHHGHQPRPRPGLRRRRRAAATAAFGTRWPHRT